MITPEVLRQLDRDLDAILAEVQAPWPPNPVIRDLARVVKALVTATIVAGPEPLPEPPADKFQVRYRLFSYKHGMWWRPECQGYTADASEAGLYTEEEAVRRVVQSAWHGDPAKATCMVVGV